MPLLMCPNCNASMSEVKRDDVAFDMCPTCRGVWLDRGELDKLIERSASAPAVVQPAYQPPPRRPDFADSDYHQGGYGKRKHKSWLSDIFD